MNWYYDHTISILIALESYIEIRQEKYSKMVDRNKTVVELQKNLSTE